MIETVVALLMFVNGEIKEHLVQKNMAHAFVGSATRRDSLVNQLPTSGRVRQLEDNIDGSKSIKKLIIQ